MLTLTIAAHRPRNDKSKIFLTIAFPGKSSRNKHAGTVLDILTEFGNGLRLTDYQQRSEKHEMRFTFSKPDSVVADFLNKVAKKLRAKVEFVNVGDSDVAQRYQAKYGS